MLGFSLLLALRVKTEALVNLRFYRRLPTRLRRRPGNAAGSGGWRGGVPTQNLGGNVSVRAERTVKEALRFGSQFGVPRLILETTLRGPFELSRLFFQRGLLLLRS